MARPYLDLVKNVLENGTHKNDRTGVGTLSLFGAQVRYDLSEGFPLLTTKKIRFSSVIYELLWFLRGSTNIHDQLTQHTPIWDAWADSKGNLGPIYGHQWRKWQAFSEGPVGTYHPYTIDQIQYVLDLLRTDPDSRRMIVSAWNPADVPRMALPPCHAFFQLSVIGGRLDLHLYQRSADIALGVPYNIASNAALLMLFARECQLLPGYFIHTLGDAHIYLNHRDGLIMQLQRDPRPLPKLFLHNTSFFEATIDDFELCEYNPHPFISFSVAV